MSIKAVAITAGVVIGAVAVWKAIPEKSRLKIKRNIAMCGGVRLHATHRV